MPQSTKVSGLENEADYILLVYCKNVKNMNYDDFAVPMSNGESLLFKGQYYTWNGKVIGTLKLKFLSN